MTNRVSVEREIFLNGERYPLGGDGRVRTIVTSQYPGKVILGDVDKDSNPRTSIIIWDDFTGGVGLYTTDGKEGLNRFAFSDLDTRYKGHLILPPDDDDAANPSVSGSIDEINEHAGLIVCALNGGTDAYIYTPGSDSWGGKVHDFPAQVTDSLNFTFGTTEYVAFAHTGGYSYSSNGTSYTDDTTDTLHMAFWDDRLWGIDNTGQLWFSSTIGVEVNDAKLPLPTGYVNGLFVGPDAAGEEILYAATEVGLYAHDAANARFVRTKVAFPQNADAGKGAATWNGDIYICPGGMAVWRYDPTRGIILSIGLDKGSGLPSAYRGKIDRLIPTHTGLLAVANGAASVNSIWSYSGIGWHWTAREGSNTIESAHVSAANATYREYHASLNRLRYSELRVGEINPDEDTISYDQIVGTRHLLTPWFNAGQNEIDKTAIRIRVDVSGAGSNETVQVGYALDYSSSFESTETSINSSGVTTATFPDLGNNSSAAGIAFRAIRFRIILTSNVTATKTPDMKSLSLEWRRKIPPKYGFEFTLDRSESYGGKTPKEMKADLITAIETSTQVEFTFVDDDGNTQNYYVDVTNMEDVEDTGHGEIGQTRIAVVEA